MNNQNGGNMKSRIIIFMVVQIITLLIFTSTLHSWTGDTWGPISRETIIRIADEMVDFSWTPKNTITNWNYGSVWRTFNAGTVYWGETYSQNNPQENWAEFYSVVNATAAGSTYYGNDCAGFVSMAWRLPTRYTTANFESDATSDGGYVIKLGEIGSGQNVGLLPGDALVYRTANDGHIVMFESYRYDTLGNKIGIWAIEQTPYQAVRTNKYTWSRLASYRPIRRNNIDEGNYVFKTKWGTEGSLNGQFIWPRGLAIDSSDNVYVADQRNHRIQKFNSNGGFIAKWGSVGTGNGQFYDPGGIAVDSLGYVYVLDGGNIRIQKFDSNGNFITKWGSFGYGNGQFNNLKGIAIDPTGNIYVSDSGNNRIQIFNNYGGFIASWGTVGQLAYPYGIAIDSYGNVYIVAKDINRIQKYSSNGILRTEWGSQGTGSGQFQNPLGIAVDPAGNVYVADKDNHRIQKFDSNGVFLTKWGSYSDWEDGKFNWPSHVAVAPSLNVYVADAWNHRIQKFAPVSQLPSSPSNLAATVASSTQNNLSWQDNSNNETGFKIMRKTGVNGKYDTTYPVGANVTSFSNTGITAGVTYYYAVWAYNSAGDSAYSNEVSATSGTGTIIQKATLDGSPWSGSLTYQCAQDGVWGPIQTSTLPLTATNRPLGVRVCKYISGGPAGATFYGIAPSDTQTLYSGGTITFTYAFSSGTGTGIHQAKLNGTSWSGSLTFQCSANGILGPVQTVTVPLTSTNRPTGPRICAYISGGPAGKVFTSITPSANQTLYPGGTITFTYNFK